MIVKKSKKKEVHRDNLTDILTVALIDIDNWIHGRGKQKNKTKNFNSEYVSLSS